MSNRLTSRVSTVRGAFTLIELLIVIAIIALLISILLPALQAARNEGTKTVCLSSMKEIMRGNTMYDNDNGESRQIPWYALKVAPGISDTLEVLYRSPEVYTTPNVITPWVFGGFRAPVQGANSIGSDPDSSVYPAQFRPLNKYVDPTASADPTIQEDRGTDVIKVYICPGDRSNQVQAVQGQPQWVEEDDKPSHEVNGSSYTLQTRWLQGATGSKDWSGFLVTGAQRSELFGKIARATIGDGAARFIQWAEIGFYSAAHSAAETVGWSTAQPQRSGWHRKFSFWSGAFADGHAQHGYFDTRQIYGMDGTLWPPNYYLGRPLN